VRNRPLRRPSILLCGLVAAIAGLPVTGCGPGGSPGDRGARVPDPDLTEMEPQVAELLGRVRRSALQRDSAETWGELGSAYDAHGLLAEAQTCYARAQELDPDEFAWAYLLAVVREIRGAEAPEVVERFERAAALRPDYAPIPVRLGAALALRGDHEGARRAFVRAVELAPRNAVAQRGLGQVLLALGDAAGAAERLAAAVELEPRDRAARSGLAQALLRLGQPGRAGEIAAKAAGLQPINAFEDPVYGERVFMRSVSSSRAFARAQAALRLGGWVQAEQDLALVLQARPDDPSAHYWRGLALRRLGHPDRAAEHLARALELQPGMVRARVELGALLVELRRFAEAIAELERAARLEPPDADGHHVMGLAYEGLGRAPEARAHFEAAVRLDPAHPAASRLTR